MNKKDEIQNKDSKEVEKGKTSPSAPIQVEKKSESEKKTKSHEEGLTEEQKLLLHTGEGVNLVPKKSKAEVQKEQKKFSFSVSSIVSLILLVSLSLGVVFFNIISKEQLKSAKKTQYQKEVNLQAYRDKYLSNEEILERTDLYREVQQEVFSPREVVEYVMSIVQRESSIEIRSFNIKDSLKFEISGGAAELEAVAKIWYLLGVDENIVTVNLNSVGKSEEGVTFSFEGQLETDKFINN